MELIYRLKINEFSDFSPRNAAALGLLVPKKFPKSIFLVQHDEAISLLRFLYLQKFDLKLSCKREFMHPGGDIF